MIQILGTYRMRMQLNASKVHDPGQSRCVIDNDFFGLATRGK
jgi:hypothetical protein